jgi:hypothetical protein
MSVRICSDERKRWPIPVQGGERGKMRDQAEEGDITHRDVRKYTGTERLHTHTHT